jgi:O-methyltransferase
MRNLLIQINAFFKGVILLIRPHFLFGFLRHPMQFSANLLALTKWISQHNRKDILNDFYTVKRDYPKRYKLYNYLLERENLKDEAIDYLEFGVSGGSSFKWWTDANKNTNYLMKYSFHEVWHPRPGGLGCLF